MNGGAPGISAAFLNAVEAVFEQNAGGTETGSYSLNAWGNASGDVFGQWLQSLSRTSVPVSVSIDTSIQAPVLCTAPTTDTLTSSGFHVKTTTTASTTSAYCAGNFTINF